jgi:outer membrane protein assembly factor BamB
VGPGQIRGRGCDLWRVCLVAALAVSLAGCSSGLPSLPSMATLKNPFKKAEERLPGERVAVITDQSMDVVDPGAAAKPIVLPAPVANPSWVEPGGNASNSFGHLALGERVNKVWRVDVGTGSSSSGRLSAVPLVADGKVFTLDAGGIVAAFAAASGAKLWSTSVTPKNEKRYEGFGGGLALDSGRLYATTGFGTVVGINPDGGAVLWTQKVGEPVRSSPTAAGGKVFFVSTDSVLHCLDGADGQEQWTARGVPEPATLLSNVSPAVGQGVVIAAFPAGDISAFQVSNGEAAWKESLSRSSETNAAGILADPARPVIDHGVVFAVSHGGKMIAASESTGERLWTRNLTGTQMPWVAGDIVYVVDVTGKLLALNRADGKVRWLTQLPGTSRWSGPVLAGGQLWLVSAEGSLVGADARSGQISSTTNLGYKVYVAPIVAGGRMYILADNATLIALN